jgi:hypothetical protein
MPTAKERKKGIRMVFKEVHKTPRIRPKEAAKILQMRPSSIGAIIREAITQGYIVGPQLRKMSFMNFITYEYLLNCEDPVALYNELLENEYIVYHAILEGFCNFRIVSEKELDIGGTMVFGPCTDHYMSFPPNRSWDASINVIQRKVNAFDPQKYTPKGIIKNHWDQSVAWTELDEILYRNFKYDLRRPIAPIMKEYNIQRHVIDEWLKKVPDCCSIFTAYFPETVSNYDPYIYMIETDYEDFVIDVFSQLPTSIYYYKVADRLFIHAWLDRGSMRSVIPLKDITKLYMLILARDLKKKEIVKSITDATVTCYWRRE